MRNRVIVAFGFAIVAFVCLASAASAEPLLDLTLTRDPAPTSTPATHGDERAVYRVDVRNTASAFPSVGTELTCPGTPVDGTDWFGANPPLTFEVEWLRNGAPISGTRAPAASTPGGNTYTITADDAGKALQCKVYATNDPDESGSEYAPITAAAVSLPPTVAAPVPTPAPPTGALRPRLVIGGPLVAGQSVSCEPPTGWTGEGLTWSYRYLRNGVPIATGNTYTLQNSDVNPPVVIQCEAIGRDANGNEAVSSSLTARTEPRPPAPYQTPALGGSTTFPVTFSNSTAGPVQVEIELPGGQETYVHRVGDPAGAGVGGWICTKTAPTLAENASARCTRSDTLGPESAYPPIELIARPGRDAPDLLVTKATVSGGGAPASSSDEDTIGPLLPALPFDFAAFQTEVLGDDGAEFRQAGGHPFSAGASFAFTEHVRVSVRTTVASAGLRAANGFVRVVMTDVPRGFVGNAQAITVECPSVDDVIALPSTCPADSAVGWIDLETSEGSYYREPIWSIPPEYGTPAQFAFGIAQLGLSYTVTPELRADDGYAIRLVSAPVQKTPELIEASAVLCGFGAKVGISPVTSESAVTSCKKRDEVGANPLPLITQPTRCTAEASTTRILADTWEDRGNFKSAESTLPPQLGCENVEFEPEIAVKPTSVRADSPTGVDVELTMPTEGLEEPDGIAQAQLKRVEVDLPDGMAVNPSAGHGLGACSDDQVKLGTNEPIACPESSKIGTMEIETPILEEKLVGNVYIARQGDVDGALIGMYIVFESKKDGLLIKIPGKVVPDPRTGRLTAIVDDSPEAPFSAARLHFAQGPRSPLLTPPKCGVYRIGAEFTPWSAPDPAKPTAAEVVSQTSSFRITRGPGGGACPRGEIEPHLEAGVTNPVAGQPSPFVLRLWRDDGTDRFTALDVKTPPGLTARLRGIPYCPEAVIASISGDPERGQDELHSPACPAESLVGTTSVGAGAGPTPYFVETGRVYLAGPYKGAPLSLALVTPAVAGPFDLGNVVVRAALRIDPVTTQITAVSDPIPTMLHGILLDIRDIRVKIDRPDFVVNPTNCDQMSVEARVTGSSGAAAAAADPFQVGGCAALGFKPRLALSLKGGTRRTAHPSLQVVLRPRPGDANISSASVALPHSAFLDQGHIRTVCTRVQFAADTCPRAAIYGYAIAHSPLLDVPLQGPVYLRSSNNPLPDVVADLRGPAQLPIKIELAGKVDSFKGGIRTTFQTPPDAPVSTFVLRMQGGTKGLIVNSRNLCLAASRATVRLAAHNGRRHAFRPAVVPKNCKKGRKGKRTNHRRNNQRSQG